MQYGGFRKHVKEAHSMWNYIYFALYLDYRDRNDHNALEKYIFEAVSTHNFSVITLCSLLILLYRCLIMKLTFFLEGKLKI